VPDAKASERKGGLEREEASSHYRIPRLILPSVMGTREVASESPGWIAEYRKKKNPWARPTKVQRVRKDQRGRGQKLRPRLKKSFETPILPAQTSPHVASKKATAGLHREPSSSSLELEEMGGVRKKQRRLRSNPTR